MAHDAVSVDRPTFDPRHRGYVIAFRPTLDNICPGCGGRQWLVGRLSAECARCATALPIVEGWRPTPGDLAA